MYYNEEKATIVAYRAEIDENPEYGHIKKLIEQNPCIWSKLNKDSIIIFDVLKTYDDGPERIDGDDLYVDTLCICTMQIMYDYSAATMVLCKKSYPEQLKKIIMEYHEHGYFISDLKTLDIPQVLRENEILNKTIVPVIIENYLGKCEDYGIEAEEEEEYEDYGERKGKGTIRIPFNDTNKEQEMALAHKIANGALADGISITYDEGVSEFVITLHHATGSQMQKYSDILTYGEVQ